MALPSSSHPVETAEKAKAATLTLTLLPLADAADTTFSTPLTLAIEVEVAIGGVAHVRPARSPDKETANTPSPSSSPLTPDTVYAGVMSTFQAAVSPAAAPHLAAQAGSLASAIDMQATNGTGTRLAQYLTWDEDGEDESWLASFHKTPESTLPSALPPRRSRRSRSWLAAIVASLLIIASSIGGLLWSTRSVNPPQPLPRTPTTYVRVSPEHGPQQVSFTVTPATIDLGTLAPGQPVALSITVNNTGSVPLTWIASPDAFWLTLGLTSGTIPTAGSPQSIPLTIDPSNLSAGNAYTTTVTITSNGGSQSVSVSFNLLSSNQTTPTSQPHPTQPLATQSPVPQLTPTLQPTQPAPQPTPTPTPILTLTL